MVGDTLGTTWSSQEVGILAVHASFLRKISFYIIYTMCLNYIIYTIIFDHLFQITIIHLDYCGLEQTSDKMLFSMSNSNRDRDSFQSGICTIRHPLLALLRKGKVHLC